MKSVPAELLVPPEAHAQRGFEPTEAALVLDGWLRRLATQEARCRALLGRLARAFLARRGQHELGFSRIDDYTRERLGISGRELQSLATVVGRLAGLPAIASAFEAGRLSWAQVRLLAGDGGNGSRLARPGPGPHRPCARGGHPGSRPRARYG